MDSGTASRNHQGIDGTFANPTRSAASAPGKRILPAFGERARVTDLGCPAEGETAMWGRGPRSAFRNAVTSGISSPRGLFRGRGSSVPPYSGSIGELPPEPAIRGRADPLLRLDGVDSNGPDHGDECCLAGLGTLCDHLAVGRQPGVKVHHSRGHIDPQATLTFCTAQRSVTLPWGKFVEGHPDGHRCLGCRVVAFRGLYFHFRQHEIAEQGGRDEFRQRLPPDDVRARIHLPC